MYNSSLIRYVPPFILTRFYFQLNKGVNIHTFPTGETEKEEYGAVNEIGAHSFLDLSHALEFIEHLPRMSAIELMLLQNFIPLHQ